MFAPEPSPAAAAPGDGRLGRWSRHPAGARRGAQRRVRPQRLQVEHVPPAAVPIQVGEHGRRHRPSAGQDERVEVVAGGDAEQERVAGARRLRVDVQRHQADQPAAVADGQRPQVALGDVPPPRDQPRRVLERRGRRDGGPQRLPLGPEPFQVGRGGGFLDGHAATPASWPYGRGSGRPCGRARTAAGRRRGRRRGRAGRRRRWRRPSRRRRRPGGRSRRGRRCRARPRTGARRPACRRRATPSPPASWSRPPGWPTAGTGRPTAAAACGRTASGPRKRWRGAPCQAGRAGVDRWRRGEVPLVVGVGEHPSADQHAARRRGCAASSATWKFFSGQIRPRAMAKGRCVQRNRRASTGTPFSIVGSRSTPAGRRPAATPTRSAGACRAGRATTRRRVPRRRQVQRDQGRHAGRRQVLVEVDPVQVDDVAAWRRGRGRRSPGARPRRRRRVVRVISPAGGGRRHERPATADPAAATTTERWPAATRAASRWDSTCSAPPTASGPTGANG